MNCIKPIMLKSGLLVPCGQCELCQSASRTEKSVLVQLHCVAYERMPMFLTLTYDDQHLIYGRCGEPSLHRPHLSEFIKKYKRDYSLTCDKFSYVACGEYGDKNNSTVGVARPHYHAIWFGDDQLHDLWLKDVHFAEDFLASEWTHGYVDVNEALWSGIHYVTKYCLKDGQDVPKGSVKPFFVSSNGIGLSWLKSEKASLIRRKLSYLVSHADELYSNIYLGDMDWSNSRERINFIEDAINQLRFYMPDFRITLPSGQRAYLPRKLRRRLLGSFEHPLDNPMYLYNSLCELYETEKYLAVNGEYDATHDVSIAQQNRLNHIDIIRKRISKRKHQ